MIVISDSVCFIALGRIEYLHILKGLFGKVFIPDAVYQETFIEGTDEIQRESINKAMDDGFIEVLTPKTSHKFKRKSLKKGERGVLSLAFDLKADLLIIDDKRARNEATELGFYLIDTITIIEKAKEMNIIESADELLKKLSDIKIYLQH